MVVNEAGLVFVLVLPTVVVLIRGSVGVADSLEVKEAPGATPRLFLLPPPRSRLVITFFN